MRSQLDQLSPEERRSMLEALLQRRRTTNQVYPMAPIQEHVYALDRQHHDTALFVTTLAVRLRGPLDIEALRGAIRYVVERHDSLRTTFHEHAGQLYQQVSASVFHDLLVEDLAEAVGACEAALTDALHAEAARPIDVATGPIMRFRTFRMGPSDHVLCVSMHRLITDTWSLGVFFHELQVSYAALRHGRQPPLTPLAVQYGEFVRRMRERAPASRSDDLGHFDALVRGITPLRWPNPSPSSSPASCRHRVPIARETQAALRLECRREGVTVFAVMLAAYFAALHAVTTQTDLVVASASMAARGARNAEPLVGLLGELLILRVEFDPEKTLRQLVQEVRRTNLQAMANQNTGLDSLTRVLEERGVALADLARVAYAHQSKQYPRFDLEDLTLEPIAIETNTLAFDAVLTVSDSGGDIGCRFEHRLCVLAPEAGAAVARSCSAFIEAWTTDGDLSLASVSWA